MTEKFQPGIPIYLQLAELFHRYLACGTWAAGQRLPSVRDLAVTFSVNPNTLQRVFAQLEQEGCLYTESTNGRFVTEDKACLSALREKIAQERIEDCRKALCDMGYTDGEICALFTAEMKKTPGEENNR